MRTTNDDIEEPVKKSWTLLVVCILVLIFTLGIGIFLLVEALQKPSSPQDVLDMQRMMISGIAVLLFSLAIVVFLYLMYKPEKKKKRKVTASNRKPVRRKQTKRSK